VREGYCCFIDTETHIFLLKCNLGKYMDSDQICQTIAHYVFRNYKELVGSLPESHHLMVCGRTLVGLKKEDSYFLKGSVVDTLAHLIEGERFFGEYVEKSVKQASNPNNALIVPIIGRKRVPSHLNLDIVIESREDSGVLQLVVSREIGERRYLDFLRQPEGFVSYSGQLGLNRNIETIADELYSS
jgi:hypothetical protein